MPRPKPPMFPRPIHQQHFRQQAGIDVAFETLDSVETLVCHSVSLRFPRWVNVTVDVDNYRRKRQAYLEGLIKKVVRDVERDHRERPIFELLPKERKFVHQYFTDHPYLTTESRGESAQRTLFITPRKDIQEV